MLRLTFPTSLAYRLTAAKKSKECHPRMVIRPVPKFVQAFPLTNSFLGTVYELVVTNSKDYGLFATENIPRGTRIIEESLLVTMSSSSMKHGLPVLNTEELTMALDSLSPKQHEAYFELYHDPSAAVKASKQADAQSPRTIEECNHRPRFPKCSQDRIYG
jgi:hypothetical protein